MDTNTPTTLTTDLPQTLSNNESKANYNNKIKFEDTQRVPELCDNESE
jgi:hypothetical protein